MAEIQICGTAPVDLGGPALPIPWRAHLTKVPITETIDWPAIVLTFGRDSLTISLPNASIMRDFAKRLEELANEIDSAASQEAPRRVIGGA